MLPKKNRPGSIAGATKNYFTSTMPYLTKPIAFGSIKLLDVRSYSVVLPVTVLLECLRALVWPVGKFPP
jgi:hypothetical protein